MQTIFCLKNKRRYRSTVRLYWQIAKKDYLRKLTLLDLDDLVRLFAAFYWKFSAGRRRLLLFNGLKFYYLYKYNSMAATLLFSMAFTDLYLGTNAENQTTYLAIYYDEW